jgi:heavy metal sensor kinase
MKSIRLSLIVYFLALLTVALVAVSVFTYQNTQSTVRAKVGSTRALVQARHEQRVRTLEEEVDDRMLRRAQTLASLAQSQFGSGRFEELYSAELVGASAVPMSPAFLALPPPALNVALWSEEKGMQAWFGARLAWMLFIHIQFADDVMPREGDGREAEYFQTYGERGRVLQRSRSLGDHSFELEPEVRERLSLFEWHFDSTELEPGVPLRRVTLKAPVSRFRRVMWPPRAPSPSRSMAPTGAPKPASPGGSPRHSAKGGSASKGGPSRGRPSEVEGTSPAIFIQCAIDARPRDAAKAAFIQELATDLDNLEAESQATLVTLRNRLVFLSLATFAAAVAGCCALVGLGLSPLRRLSEAVSRVSEKQMRLQVDAAQLPRELRPIVERLAQTLGLLERAFAREKQAAADISHELRTPLAALLTTVEVALRKPRAPEEYREMLADCKESCKQMSQLVERLLALARLDARVDTLRLHPVDAAVLTEQCAALVRPLAEARGLRLSVHLNGPANLAADPDKLREVVTNLLHNAIEYNRPDGSVDVRVGRENGHLCLEVRDTGIGIAPAAREHIFERFYRVDPARQAEGLHAGLGLAIVKGYVDLMGGRIVVESEEGRGSTFRVELPATAEGK